MLGASLETRYESCIFNFSIRPYVSGVLFWLRERKKIFRAEQFRIWTRCLPEFDGSGPSLIATIPSRRITRHPLLLSDSQNI